MYAVVGLQTSGLGRRRRPKGFSEAPGRLCLSWYPLSYGQSIIAMSACLWVESWYRMTSLNHRILPCDFLIQFLPVFQNQSGARPSDSAVQRGSRTGGCWVHKEPGLEVWEGHSHWNAPTKLQCCQASFFKTNVSVTGHTRKTTCQRNPTGRSLQIQVNLVLKEGQIYDIF